MVSPHLRQVYPDGSPGEGEFADLEADGAVSWTPASSRNKYQLTTFLTFRGKSEREQFERAFRQETPWLSIVAMMMFLSFVVIAETIRMVTIKDGDGVDHDEHIIFSLCVLCIASCAVVCRYKWTEGSVSFRRVRQVEEFTALLIAISSCIVLVARASRSCTTKLRWDDVNTQCGERQELRLLPPESVAFTGMIAVFLDCAMPTLRWPVVVTANTVCSVTLLILLGAFRARNSALSVVISIGISFFCIFMKRYNRLHAFRKIHLSVEQKNQSLRKDFEKVRQETAISDATEWRHIVSNVAHDLKTPVAAMSAGCDFLLSLLSDVTKIATRYNVFAHLQSDLSSLSSTAESMQHTCAFMTMMVHRYVDYTKTSHGLALVPHLEMVRLLDTIVQGPMACVKDVMALGAPGLSARGSRKSGPTPLGLIKVVPVPPEVRTVVTDKRWLEENVLCLLSNAVKYSGNQPVDLRVELVEVEGAASASGEEAVSEASVRRQLVKISVSDSGVGIPPEERESLFQAPDPSSRSSGGTGLGLYVLAHRVSALGGSCGVADRIDGSPGSVVWFSFPFTAAVDEEQWRIGRRSFSVDQWPDSQTRLVSVFSSDTQPLHDGEGSPYVGDLVFSASAAPSRVVSIDGYGLGSRQPLPGLWLTPSLVASDRVRRVLVVDDSAIILKMVTNVLRRAGYVVEGAENGRVAIDKLRAHSNIAQVLPTATSDEYRGDYQSGLHSVSPLGSGRFGTEATLSSLALYYDAVLLDLQMPVMDGFEACRAIRQMEAELAPSMRRQTSGELSMCHNHAAHEHDDEHPRSPLTNGSGRPTSPPASVPYRQLIIGCSANSDSVTIQQAYAAGVDAFLPKPFALSAFQAIVSSHMGEDA